MRENLLSITIALMMSVVLFACFMNPIFASEVDEDGGWSEDETTYAYVLGKYSQIDIHANWGLQSFVKLFSTTFFIQQLT